MDKPLTHPRCDICTLSRNRFLSEHKPCAKYLVITNAPTLACQSGILDSGSPLTLVKKIFGALGVNDNEIQFVSLLQCRPPGRDATPKEYEACGVRFENGGTFKKYEKVLLLGGQVTRRLLGVELHECRSLPSMYAEVFGDAVALATYSADYVIMKSDYIVDLVEDITKLVRYDKFNNIAPDIDKLSEYQVCSSECDVLTKMDSLFKFEYVSFDIETTGLDPKTCSLRCVGLGTEDLCYIIPGELFTEPVKRKLEELSRNVKIVAHYSNFEYSWMLKLGVDMLISSDTILKHHCIDERTGISRRLKWLGTRYCNVGDWSTILQHKGTPDDTGAFAAVPEELLYPYLAHDIKITAMLNSLFDKHPEAPPKKLFEFIMDARRVLSEISHYGIPIDLPYLFDLYQHVDSVTESPIEEMRAMLDDETFNPRSSRMVSDVLFDRLGLPLIHERSTGKKVMHQLRHKYPEETLITMIDDTRKTLAIQSTYIKGLYQCADHETGKLHTTFRQDRTATGRLACMDPNLQNIPIRTELGRLIRKAFTPPPDYDYVVEFDYSQIEVYIAAVISNDKNMLQLLANGGDIYRKAASEFYGKSESEISAQERDYFKPIILGSLYLRSAAAIAEQNFTDVAEEKAKQELFFKMYPDYYASAYGRWSEDSSGRRECLIPGALEKVLKLKHTTTMFGRKRRFPYILADKYAETRREALNAPIQGTASDICLSSLCRIYSKAKSQNLLDSIRPWNIIHDAVLLWITEEYKSKCKEFVLDIMLNPCIDLPIPLKVEAKIGRNWGEMEKWNN